DSVSSRLYGGLSVSQAVQSFILSHPNRYPHTVNFKFIAPGNISDHLEFNFGNFEDGSIVTVRASQNNKTIGIAHIRYSKEADYLDVSTCDCSEYTAPDD
ncbi:hypothetical protein PMAYCL1PPCAC_05284, partial [Pristionchus mayeri]